MTNEDQVNNEDRLEELHYRNDQIEQRLAQIDKHGRRESFSEDEVTEKHELQSETK